MTQKKKKHLMIDVKDVVYSGFQFSNSDSYKNNVISKMCSNTKCFY